MFLIFFISVDATEYPVVSLLDQTQLGQALFQFHWATTKKDKGEFFYALVREQAHSEFSLVSYALRLLRCGV